MAQVNSRMGKAAPRPATRVLAVTLPLLAVAALQLGGCTRDSARVPIGGTYLSKSAGASFDQAVAVADSTEGATIARFTLHASHRPAHAPGTIYVAADRDGIVRSNDDGETWQVIATPLSAALDVVELENGVLVVSGLGPEGQGFILRSLDEGKSWQTVLTVPVPPQQNQQFQIIGRQDVTPSVAITIAPDPLAADRIYAGSNLGSIFVGEQSAKIWRSSYVLTGSNAAFAAPPSIARIIPSPHTRGELLLITAAQELWRVTEREQVQLDIPQDVNRVPNEFTVSIAEDRGVLDASYVQQFPQALLVGVEDGAVISRDGGQSWVDLPLPVEASQQFNNVVVEVSPTNPNRLLVAINEVIYRSEDGGGTWNTFSLGTPSHVITDLLINPANAARVLAVTKAQEA